MSEIVLNRNEVVIVDMEAGIEHLGRATAKHIDKMLIVVEPGYRSVETANTIIKMSREIGVQHFVIIGNKINNKQQQDWIGAQFPNNQISAIIPYHKIIQSADLLQQPLYELLDDELKDTFTKIFRVCSSDISI